MTKPKVRLLLDSGAYSAWTMQTPIAVRDYIAWVIERRELIHSIIGLDVIPGTFGQKRTQRDVDAAAEKSYANLQEMKAARIPAIPVFHRGESFKWLERYLKDGETYIGLSPLVDSAEQVKRHWLDQCFSLITDAKGWATVKTHGFGVTNPILMMRYPWYSVDSTSWVKGGGFGKINVPIFQNGKFNYLRAPAIIHASEVSRAKPSLCLAGLGPHMQKMALKYIEERGFTLTEMMISRAKRCAMMLAYYNDLEKLLPLQFKDRATGFGAPVQAIKLKPAQITKALEGGLNKKFYLYHSTNTSNDQSSLLTEMGAFNRLLSYHELRDVPDARFEEYVRYGMERDYIRKQPPAKWEGRRYTSFRRMKLLKRHDDYGSNSATRED